MTNDKRILVPIGETVHRFGLVIRAIPVKPTARKKGRGKRRPCRVEIVMGGKKFPLEPAHGGYDSTKRKPFGSYLLRWEGTAHVRGLGGADAPPKRVAVIAWREIPAETAPAKKSRTSFARMDKKHSKRRTNKIQRADLE